MYDDVLFADRFRYPMTMFGNRVLIGLSLLLPAHISYETDTAKIIAAIRRISYCLRDLIRLNLFVRHALKDMMYDDIVFADRFRYQLTMFEVYVLIWLSGLLYTHIAYEIVI